MAKQPELFEGLPEPPAPLLVEAMAIYNEVAERVGWPKAMILTSARQAALKRAVGDYGGLPGFRRYLGEASESDFLTGRSGRDERHRNWKPDLDWFCKGSTVVKIVEKKFANKRGAEIPGVSAPAPADPLAGDRAKLRNYRKGGWWPAHYGPRPEAADCRLHPTVLQEWRELNRVSVVANPRVVESPADRLRALVVIYRKVGRYDDANRVEAQLAALEGRPPVLAICPDDQPTRGTRPMASFVKPGHVSDADWREEEIPF